MAMVLLFVFTLRLNCKITTIVLGVRLFVFACLRNGICWFVIFWEFALRSSIYLST
jgi:hypothetical protein